MVDKIIQEKTYYFINKEITIIHYKEIFNLAIVRYVDSLNEFVVDINFIDTIPLIEKFISVAHLTGREKI